MLRLDDDVRAADDERLGHRAENPLRHDHRTLVVVDALDHHRELVAAETCARVLRPDDRANPVRDGDEQLVAGRVAEAVVHRLEVVEVDEEDGEQVPTSRAPFDRVRDPFGEEGAVRETRERVVERLMRELILERAALGDVSRGHHHAADVRDAEQVVEDALELDDAAVLSAQRQVARHRSAGHRAHLGEEPAELLGVLVLRGDP